MVHGRGAFPSTGRFLFRFSLLTMTTSNTASVRDRELIVVKAGTDTVTTDGKIDQEVLDYIAEDVEGLMEEFRVMLVLSGAVGSGKSLVSTEAIARLGNHKRGFSTLGQPLLMRLLSKHFKRRGIILAQGLIKEANLRIPECCDEMRAAYEELLDIDDAIPALHVVPVLNGNDFETAASFKTDNDRVAGDGAKIFGASRAIFLTDKPGLLTNLQDDTTLIQNVRAGTGEWKRHVVRDKKSLNGTGGFYSKCEVADELAMEGIVASIGYGKTRHAIRDILKGSSGTTFRRDA